MSENQELHKLLISRQSRQELKRKRDKAHRKNIWTQEDINHAERWGFYMSCKLNGVNNK